MDQCRQVMTPMVGGRGAGAQRDCPEGRPPAGGGRVPPSPPSGDGCPHAGGGPRTDGRARLAGQGEPDRPAKGVFMDAAALLSLPYVDEHTTVVAADAEVVWDALGEVLDRSFGRGRAAAYARLVGCADRTASGPRPLGEGSTTPGFRVASAVPGAELVLTPPARADGNARSASPTRSAAAAATVRARTWSARRTAPRRSAPGPVRSAACRRRRPGRSRPRPR